MRLLRSRAGGGLTAAALAAAGRRLALLADLQRSFSMRIFLKLPRQKTILFVPRQH
jgi:hypothetical protein